MIRAVPFMWRSRRRGFILLPVIALLVILAAFVVMLNRENATGLVVGQREAQVNSATFVAEAGLEHAKWSASGPGTCTGYKDLTDVPFGDHQYSATYSPSYGSPVTVEATGSLAEGASQTLVSDNMPVYQAATSLTLQPNASRGQDTHIFEGSPTGNRGNWTFLRLTGAYGGGNERRPLLHFDLDSIPENVTIISAALELNLMSSNGVPGAVRVHRLLNSWDEDSVTWLRREAGELWDQPGGDFWPVPSAAGSIGITTGVFHPIDVTALVANWAGGASPNFGLAIVSLDPGTDLFFRSSDDIDATLHPRLTINYSCECGQACQAGNDVLLVVDDTAALTQEQLDKTKLMADWGHSVTLIGTDATPAEFDAAAASSDVVYIPELGATALAELGTKADDLAVGIITEEAGTPVKLGSVEASPTVNGRNINIVDNTHYLTETLALGSVTLSTATQSFWKLGGTLAPDLHVLGDWTGALPGLAYADIGELLNDGQPAPGRRVKLPWGSNDFDVTQLTDEGREIMKRAIEWGADASDVNRMVLSTASAAELGGLSFLELDLVRYVRSADTATLFLDGLAVGMTKKIDALHVLANGNLVLSTDGDTTFAGLTFKGDDLIEYDPVADTATMFLEAAVHFQAVKNIISVHILDNENIVLSTDGGATLGGLAYSDRDLVEYNRVTGEASIFFDGDSTTLSQKISAVHVLKNGNIVLAATGDTTLGGVSFGKDRLVEYDPVTGNAEMFFDGSTLFTETSEEVKSVHIGAGRGTASASFDHRNVLFVVGDSTSLTNEESAHQALLEGWGHTIEVIDDGAGQPEFDASVASNDVVFTTSDINPGTLGAKLVNSAIGVVTSEDHLSDEFGISSSIGWNSGTDIVIDDSSHFITSPFSVGAVTVFEVSNSLAYVAGSLSPDLGELASSTSGFALVSLDADAETFGGGNAAGRRVQLPWGGAGFDPDDLTPAGRTVLQRSLDWAASVVGSGSGGGNDTWRDEFNAKSYSGSDGTLAWSTDWLEIGEADGPAKNDEQVRSDGDFDYVLRIRDNDNGGEGVQREADMSGCSDSQLTFDYRRKSFDDHNDYVTVDVSANGGSSWTEVSRLSGPADESTYQTTIIDIGFALAVNTRIRFLGSPQLGGTDELFVDNVVMSCL